MYDYIIVGSGLSGLNLDIKFQKIPKKRLY